MVKWIGIIIVGSSSRPQNASCSQVSRGQSPLPILTRVTNEMTVLLMLLYSTNIDRYKVNHSIIIIFVPN